MIVGGQSTKKLIKDLQIDVEICQGLSRVCDVSWKREFYWRTFRCQCDLSKSASGRVALHTAAKWGLTSLMKKMDVKTTDISNSMLLRSGANHELSNFGTIKLLVKMGLAWTWLRWILLAKLLLPEEGKRQCSQTALCRLRLLCICYLLHNTGSSYSHLGTLSILEQTWK